MPAAFVPRVPTVTQSAPDELEVEGEGIYCPVCNYNLSGVHSGRCPECGALFSRTALLDSQASQKIVLMPWDRPDHAPFFRRFRETLSVCLLKAERFAFAFSVQPQRSNVWTFYAWVLFACMAMAVMQVAISLAFTRNTIFMPSNIVAIFAGYVAFTFMLVTSLTFVPALLLWTQCRHFDGRRHFAPWLSICAYASAHFLLLGVCVPLGLVPAAMNHEAMTIVSVLCVVGVVALWGCTMRAVIDMRRSRWETGPFLMVALTLTAAGCMLVSFVLAGMVSELAASI